MKKIKRVWLAVDEELHEKVVSIAEMEDRSIQGQYRRLVTKALERCAVPSREPESSGKLIHDVRLKIDDELRDWIEATAAHEALPPPILIRRTLREAMRQATRTSVRQAPGPVAVRNMRSQANGSKGQKAANE